MEAVFLTLVNISIAASLLAGAVAVVRFCFKKAPRSLICSLWLLVAIRLMLPFFVESEYSFLPTNELIPENIIDGFRTEIIPGGDVSDDTLVGDANSSTVVDDIPSYLIYGDTEIKFPVVTVTRIATVIWMAGALLIGGYAVISYFRLRSRIAEAVPVEKEINIWICDRVQSPFIIGMLRPRIILPSSIDEGDKAYVTAHERTHLQRGDHLWKALGFALLTVYWFNPVMWAVYVLLCRDIEIACDERVIKNMETEEKRAYTLALLNASVSRKIISACPLAFGEVGVKSRIKSVLSYKKPALWIIVATLIVTVVIAVGFLTDPAEGLNTDEMLIRVEKISTEKKELRFLGIIENKAVVLEGESWIDEFYGRVIDVPERRKEVTVEFNQTIYFKNDDGETVYADEFILQLGEKKEFYGDKKCNGTMYTLEIISRDTAIDEIPNYDTPYIIDTIYDCDGKYCRLQELGVVLGNGDGFYNDGDKVIILYDGGLRESDPPQFHDCYAIFIYSRAEE